MVDPMKVLLISGSLRAGSVNGAVLCTAEELSGGGMTATLYSGMAELPHFNPDDDLDGGAVARPVAQLREQLRESDAVLLCTPEYAGALPGAFKNLLDWTVGGGETYEKPMAWINASSRLVPDAAAGAHLSLRAVLNYTGVDIVEAACRRIVVPRTAIGADGIITDPSIREQIQATLRALADHLAPSPRPPAKREAALSIEQLKPEDRTDWEELFRAYLNFYERTPPAELYDSAWQAFRRDQEVHALGARLDGELVGIVHFLVHANTSGPPVCYLQDLFTAPHARGNGVARTLIAEVSTWAQGQGCGRVYWLTHHSNRVARGLYDQVARESGFIRYEIEL
jgi:NAD(P)H-dependent FMN reductase/GNAT superfamily N-acetyltransferase